MDLLRGARPALQHPYRPPDPGLEQVGSFSQRGDQAMIPTPARGKHPPPLQQSGAQGGTLSRRPLATSSRTRRTTTTIGMTPQRLPETRLQRSSQANAGSARQGCRLSRSCRPGGIRVRGFQCGAGDCQQGDTGGGEHRCQEETHADDFEFIG